MSKDILLLAVFISSLKVHIPVTLNRHLKIILLIHFYICLACVSSHYKINSMATSILAIMTTAMFGHYCTAMFWSPLYYQDLCSCLVSIFRISKQNTCINHSKSLFLSWPQPLHLKIEQFIPVCFQHVFLQITKCLGAIVKCETPNQWRSKLLISLSKGKSFFFFFVWGLFCWWGWGKKKRWL